jgi:hypothetical protein
MNDDYGDVDELYLKIKKIFESGVVYDEDETSRSYGKPVYWIAFHEVYTDVINELYARKEVGLINMYNGEETFEEYKVLWNELGYQRNDDPGLDRKLKTLDAKALLIFMLLYIKTDLIKEINRNEFMFLRHLRCDDWMLWDLFKQVRLYHSLKARTMLDLIANKTKSVQNIISMINIIEQEYGITYKSRSESSKGRETIMEKLRNYRCSCEAKEDVEAKHTERCFDNEKNRWKVLISNVYERLWHDDMVIIRNYVYEKAKWWSRWKIVNVEGYDDPLRKIKFAEEDETLKKHLTELEKMKYESITYCLSYILP